MQHTAELSTTILDALYRDALELTEDVRDGFDFSRAPASAEAGREPVDITLAHEALNSSTRMMHALAWLLNQRAHLAGEISDFQLSRQGRLPPANNADVAHRRERWALLPPRLNYLIEQTEDFYARIERLDHAWRARFTADRPGPQRLRERIDRALHENMPESLRDRA